MSARAEDLLSAIIEEVKRVDRLRALVVKAGFVRSTTVWTKCSEVTTAVAALEGRPWGKALGEELRRLMKADGWLLRRTWPGGWQWGARLVKRKKKP